MPFVLIRLFWRAFKEPTYLVNLKHRFGFVPSVTQPLIWVHAVSAGETIAAAPLIERLLIMFPEHRVLVTNMTPTGRERVMSIFGGRVYQAYAPYDLPGGLKRFLIRTNPSILILVDTELWPNMLHLTNKRCVSTVLVNGRLSEKSASGYARVSKLTREMLGNLSHAAVQTENQGNRFLALGLEEKKLSITGSIKFDLKLPVDLDERKSKYQQRLGSDRVVLVAGSTHKGEEAALLQSCTEIFRSFPEMILVLAPRHPHRFAEVELLLTRQKFRYHTFTSGHSCDSETQIFLVDALGELLYFYSLADIAFIGGSLVPTGGHNLMEAGEFGVPIIMGEHIHNVEDIANQFLSAGALELVKTDQLTGQIMKLLEDPESRKLCGAAALEVMERNKGAMARVETIVSQYVDSSDR